MVEAYEQCQARQRALLMLNLMVQEERDIEDGQTLPQQQVFADLRQRLKDGEPAED